MAGLALRVLPSGAKTWALRARLNGQRIRIDLGTYPATTLKDARRKAQDALRIIERGDDPRYEGITVAEAVTEYLSSKIGDCRARTLANERRRFELHVLPVIGSHGIRTVKPARLSALLRGIATGADAKPVEANRVYMVAARVVPLVPPEHGLPRRSHGADRQADQGRTGGRPAS